MNILIIGNGFDLAHELPTSYKEFLDIITELIYMGENERYSVNPSPKIPKEFYESILKYKNHSEGTGKICDIFKIKEMSFYNEMIKLSNNNIWIKWFNRKAKINNTWIDFESEISRVVQIFEKMQLTISNEKFDLIKKNYDRDIISLFIEFEVILKDITYSDFEKYKKKMTDDLNDLIRCFEIYLEHYVRKIDKNLLSLDIYNLRINKLLSFNYTDTYQRLYSCKFSNINYDYVHGKSKIENDILTNNMVMGIDEYLKGEEIYTNVEFIEFKKYYQRIHKKTGCIHNEWIDEIDEGKDIEKHNVYIFGHSLAITDKDILIKFIEHEKTYITIYYYNQNDYGNKIANLVKILGSDKLNSMVYGRDPKIKFLLQKEMVSRDNTEWNLFNDMNLLKKLEQLNNKDQEKLIEKIMNKIIYKDLNYFHSQENVISLFHSILEINDRLNFKLPNLNEQLYDDFVDIAKKLYNRASYKFFKSDYLENFNDCYRPLYTNDSTIKLINCINNFNLKVIKKDILHEHDLNILYDNLLNNKFEEETSLETLCEIYKLFKDPDKDIVLLWECIYKLIENIGDLKLKDFSRTIHPTNFSEEIYLDHILETIRELEGIRECERHFSS